MFVAFCDCLVHHDYTEGTQDRVSSIILERKINMTEEQNLLTGSVPKKLALFAIPLLLANVLQSLYNVVDMLVVGQVVGDTGLAAIGNASKLCYIINFVRMIV